MHRMAQPFIGNAQCDGLSHQIAGNGGLLNLLRTDPIARALNHRIAARDEIEQAIFLAPDGITRPNSAAAIFRRRRSWPKPASSAFRVLPVSLRNQRPAMHQFALCTRPRHRAVFIND